VGSREYFYSEIVLRDFSVLLLSTSFEVVESYK